MHSSSRTTRLRSGFTLIELLVVIGIISLLIGILLPSLRNVRRTAWALKSMTNLRQWGLGMHLWATENNGWIPWAGEDRPDDPPRGEEARNRYGQTYRVPYWFANAIPPRVGEARFMDQNSATLPPDNSIFVDPNARLPEHYPNAGGYDRPYYANDGEKRFEFFFCYVMNSALNGRDGMGQHKGPMLEGLPRVRMDQLRRASGTVLMIEKRTVREELDEPSALVGPFNGYRTRDLARVKGDWQRFTTRHFGGGHLVFADGHARRQTFVEVTTPTNAPRNPNTLYTNPRIMNRHNLIWSPYEYN